jgi:hypothetical protein
LIFHLITLKYTTQSVGLLWTRDRPDAETSTGQHKHCTRQTSMPPVGFDPSKRSAADLRDGTMRAETCSVYLLIFDYTLKIDVVLYDFLKFVLHYL